MGDTSKNSKLKSQLAKLMVSGRELISVSDAAKAWGLSREKTTWHLHYLCKQGWLSRVKRGYYLPVEIGTDLDLPPLKHPWAVITELFAPCYIAGWSACEYWDLTEQIFITTAVMTTNSITQKEYNFNGSKYLLGSIQEEMFFGTKTVWQGQVKTQVSDPSKTIIDIFYKPKLGCGMRQVVEFYKNYLESEHKDTDLLLEYALKLNKGVVFKRLGFITEKFFPEEKSIIETSLANLSKGYSCLDTDLPKDKIITKWKLWVSNSWTGDMQI